MADKKMARPTEPISKKRVLSAILMLACNLLFFLTIWLANKYDDVSIDQFLFQMKSSAAGANRSLMNSAYVRVGVFSVVATLLEVLGFLLISGRWKGRLQDERYARLVGSRACRFFTRHVLPIVLCLLVISTAFFVIELDVPAYVKAITTESDFIRVHYVDPNQTTLTFPQKKRNLIYIFLESMETTFADSQAGGPITENYIPELTRLAQENISFTNTADIGGALSFEGTTWTAAAMVAQTCGMPVKVPLNADNYGGEDAFLPGVVSIGEVLEAQGYNQTLLVGSDAAFAGRDSYFTEHGNYNIVDINSLKAEGRLPEDYRVWWGFEDLKLFDFAKEEITKLAEAGEPFNFTMLTCDTHFPNGYLCEACEEKYDSQYANVLACSSKQVYSFISWIQQQPFYADTAIVISGDHLTMDPDFFKDMDENYVRTVYNCIINSAVPAKKTQKRQFGTFDLFPTTLAAMGVQIDGEQLGLGINLFSGKKTLTEQYGYDFLDNELQKKSEYYNRHFLGMDTREVRDADTAQSDTKQQAAG